MLASLPPTPALNAQDHTAVHEAPAATVADEESVAPVPTTAVREAESAVLPGLSPSKRRWFLTVLSAAPAPAPEFATIGDTESSAPLVVPERLQSTSTSNPTIVLSESPTIGLSPLSSSALAPAAPAPQEPEISTTRMAPKLGWFLSTATPAAPTSISTTATRSSTSSNDCTSYRNNALPLSLPLATPTLVLPAPPDLASAMETLEAGPEPTPPPPPVPESAPAPAPAPARRSWFSSYTPSSSTSTSSLPTPLSAPAPSFPPRPAY